MKKIISKILIFSFLFSGLSFAKSSEENLGVDQILKTYKKNILIEKMDHKLATEIFVSQVVQNNITISQLEFYMLKNSGASDYKNFKEILEEALVNSKNLKDLGESELAFLLNFSMEKTINKGSHFMSCKTAYSIGLPIVIVGVILGITAIIQKSASREKVVEEFLDRKREETEDHLNIIADLKLEEETYKADIIYYDDEIDELTRRINSGAYSSDEIAEMRLLVEEYETLKIDSEGLIEEVRTDLIHFEDKFVEVNQERESEERTALEKVENRQKQAKGFAIAAGISGSVGSVIYATASSDCN